jgi:predicted ester cyclase
MNPAGADRNRAAARRISFELFAAGQLALMDELTTPGFVNHGQTGGVPDADGRASLAIAVARVRGGFPDLRYELLHEIAEGDLVVHHLQAHGTQLGEFAGAPASGRAAQWREVHIMRFEDARMAEQWGVVDRLAVLQQLGLMPRPPRP